MRIKSVQVLLALVIILFHVNAACGQAAEKQQDKSPAVSTTTIPLGKWTGNMTVKATPVPMELTLANKGKEWRVSVTFDMGTEQVSNPVEDLKITDNQISFTTEIGGAQVKFSGKHSGGKIQGTLDAFKKSQKADSGTWSVQRQKK